MAHTILLFALLGAGTGALYALSSLGLVLTYRGSGVVNFASGAMGLAGTFAYYEIRDVHHLPAVLAVAGGVLLSALLGWLTYQLMKPLHDASNLTRVVVSLAVLVVLVGLLGLRYPAVNSYTVASMLPTGSVSILGSNVGVDRMIILAIAVGLTAVVFAAYRYTRFGLATTAVAENREALSTLGWSSDAIAGGNWALGAGLAAVAGILLAPITGLSVGLATVLLLPGLAAAVIGNLSSFPMTLVGGLIVGIIQSELQRYVQVPGIGDAVPFAVIILVVVLRGRRLPLRSAVHERLPRVTDGVIQYRRLAVYCLILVVLLWTVPLVWVSAITFTLIGAIILESIVVTTGFAGQISLAQWAIAGCGAFVFAWLRYFGLPFELAVALAVLAGLPIGLVIGSAALRARGMALAFATLAFSVCIVSLVLTNYSINGGPAGITIGNFRIFGIPLDSSTHPDSYATFVLIVFVLVAIAIGNVRRGRTGRRLLAVRANERAAVSLGLNVTVTKLAAFCYGAMIAALGGVLVIAEFPVADFSGFDVFTSINLINYSVVGGVGFITGPIVGGQGAPAGIGTQLFSYFGASSQQYLQLFFGILTLFVIVRAPDGIAKLQSDQHRRHMDRLRKLLRRGPRKPKPPLALPAQTPELSRVGQALIEVRGLQVTFGAVRAVDDVSFDLRSGEVLGVIGPNGAGKTTLIDALTGFTPVRAGSIQLDGADISRLSAHRRAQLGIGRSFQSLELFDDLTIYENILAACERRDALSWASDVFRPGKPKLTPGALTAVRNLNLEATLARLPGELSYGMRRLAVIARTIAARPRVILLDEPAAGLDTQEREELIRVIRSLAGDWGMAVLLIEHDVALVSEVSDRMIALDFGRLVTAGTPEEVRQDPSVVASYLGIDVVNETTGEVDEPALGL